MAVRIPCCVLTCNVRFARPQPIPHLLAMPSGVTGECRAVAIADAVIRLPVLVTLAGVRMVAESRERKHRSSRDVEIEDSTQADSERVESASTNRGTGRWVLSMEKADGSQWGAVSCIVGRLSNSHREGKQKQSELWTQW
jgi:hypothetical protein